MKQYRLINNVLGWVTFAIAAFTYLTTIEPTVSFWDCGEFITSAYKLEVGHPPGAPFFMLTGNLFSQFASSPEMVAKLVNTMSALCSALTILFLFWSITHLARRIILKEGKRELTLARTVAVMGSGLVGALAYTFSDTFWFSAVEGEVYAYSSLFTAVVFWLILKWEETADRPHADRWIILIAYFMGLSIGVHLLNLLCIPAIALVYYYRKAQTPTTKGMLLALAGSFAIIFVMMYGVVQGLVEVCGWFELFFVNQLGMPYNSGVFAYILIVGAVIVWAIWETMRDAVNPFRMKIAFLLSITLLGIPFVGNGYLLGVLLIAVLAGVLFYVKKINFKMLNTVLVALMVIMVGYSSYALILIRSTADTPMNQNAPKDVLTLRSYLAREQYGNTPLLYGQTYASDVERKSDGQYCTAVEDSKTPIWNRVIKRSPDEKDRYYISDYVTDYKYVPATMMFFSRMYSPQSHHVDAYKQWANIKGQTVRYNRCGESVSVIVPTFAENLRFFFRYQLNFMYWRYFLWNFSGRQNDLQGHGDILSGNAMTGIKFIDSIFLGPQDNMPIDIENNKGHNVYYMLPLLLGLLGIFYQLFSGRKGVQTFWITFFLFFMTGIAIVLYLNQTPYQPRERDYAYAGSFYAFCIWIGFGVAALARGIEKFAKAPAIASAAVASVVCLFVPVQMASQTWDDHDRSGRTVARDFGANYLESCEPNAIIFTNGDNDTFPLWYAQEVEGIRTDVRVCNTSYLQTDWYTDQMKREAYNSAPLPITWTREQYVQGTRDVARVIKRMDTPIELGQALQFLRSDDPRTKEIPNYAQHIDHFPSDKLVFAIDSTAVINNNALDARYRPYMAKEMLIDLAGKDMLGKEALSILDMLHTNNWERPIYYAITVDPEQFVNMQPYFQRTGMAYQIVPMNTAQTGLAINTERMYDNVMNKFRWGGLDKPGVYIEETTMRQCKSYRTAVFGDLAAALIAEGKNDKALAVLDKAMQVLPPENVPYDGAAIPLATGYLRIGQKEKGLEILQGIAVNSMRTLDWLHRLTPAQLATVQSELRFQLAVMQNVLQAGTEQSPDFGKEYRDRFQSYASRFMQSQQAGGR